MNSQEYDKRVRFERPCSDQGDFGHRPPDVFELVTTAWANIRPAGSNERLAAFQMQSGQTHVVTVRYRPELQAARGDWRIVFGARVLQIIGQPRNIDERNERLVIDCSEGDVHVE